MLPRRADQGQQACRDAFWQASFILGERRCRPSHGLPGGWVGQ
jgi:hypothetical protein